MSSAVLQGEIDQLVKQGYRVVSQTESTAQLVRPKRFSIIWALIAMPIFYLPYHLLLKKERQTYLRVEADGHVHKS